MRERTERCLVVTVFDAICVDKKDKAPIRIQMQVTGFYKLADDIAEVVRLRSLLNPRLEIHRILNIRYLAEFRSMTDAYFRRHATLKDFYYEKE